MNRNSSDVDLDRLLPHRPPFRLLQEVVEWTEDGLVARASIPADAWFATPEGVSPLLGLEMGAQAIGLCEALNGSVVSAGRPRVGYLVAIRKALFHCRELPVDQGLLVQASREGGAGRLSMFSISVALEAEPRDRLVEARISVFAGDDVIAEGE